MDSIIDDMKSCLGHGKDKNYIQHYGMPKRSGRYPYGSGKDAYERSNDFFGRIKKLKQNGWTETPDNIKKEFGLSVKEYRMEKSISKNELLIYKVNTANELKNNGLSPTEIGKKMNVNESTVRGWFKQQEDSKMYQAIETADFLKEQIKEKGMIDIGVDVERSNKLNISRERLDTAIYMLEKDGYVRLGGRVPQPTNPNNQTTLNVLAPPGTHKKAIFEYDKIKTIDDYVSQDDGKTFQKKFTYPSSLNSKRLQVKYKDDGGEEKDGIIELRRGVDDLSLGSSKYSQVRILVDDTHYIKGMAVYKDDMPDGVDIIFNTNKNRSNNKLDALKPIKNDKENPFGSSIKDVELGGQYWYKDSNGKEKLGLINKRADEGDWSDWKDTLPSQFLSKQPLATAKKQLNLAKANNEDEFAEIKSLTNPTIKKYYLEKFADKCDAAAVDLKAASLPGQKYHVIIPNNTLKDNEVYAPGYKDGTKLALVRYPHGGTFEIPICTVNNKNALGKKIIGNQTMDAITINSKVAARLSGADFDGDTVMCIPTHDRRGKVKVQNQDELRGLKGFDNKLSYGTKEVVDNKGNKKYINSLGKEIKVMSNTNLEMGKISNLITDMTLLGASNDDLAKAVRHSMVVIDAEKHKLDYKKSYIDNNIAALKKRWQPKFNNEGDIIGGGGAYTLISKSKSPVDVDKRKGEPKINIKGKSWYDSSKPIGSLIYNKAPDNELYYTDSKYDKRTKNKTIITTNGKKITYNMNNDKDRDYYEPIMRTDKKTGKIYYSNKDDTIQYVTKKRTTESRKMKETDDAYTLVSKNKHPMEIIYADYANSMKDLANRARIELVNTR